MKSTHTRKYKLALKEGEMCELECIVELALEKSANQKWIDPDKIRKWRDFLKETLD
jgi:hypothetical protein